MSWSYGDRGDFRNRSAWQRATLLRPMRVLSSTIFVLVLCSLSLVAQAPSDDLASAQGLYRSGKFEQAQQRYESLVKADPKQRLAQAGLIRSLLAQEKVDEAGDVAAKAIAAMPDAEPVVAAMG